MPAHEAPPGILPLLKNVHDRDNSSVMSNLTDVNSNASPKRSKKRSFLNKLKKPDLSSVIKRPSVKCVKEELAKIGHMAEHMAENATENIHRPNTSEMKGMLHRVSDAGLGELKILEGMVSNFPGKVGEIDLIPKDITGAVKRLSTDYTPEIKVNADMSIEVFANEAAKKKAKKEARKKKKEARDAKLKAREEKR